MSLNRALLAGVVLVLGCANEPTAARLPAALAPEVDAVPRAQVTLLVPERESAGLISAEALDAPASLLPNVALPLMIRETDRAWTWLAEGDTRTAGQFPI